VVAAATAAEAAVPGYRRGRRRRARAAGRHRQAGPLMAMTDAAVLRTPVTFRRVRSNLFPWAARIGGGWHVLRLNSFPDHPLHTLFIDGACIGDLDDLPDCWHLEHGSQHTPLTPQERQQVLTLMRGLGPYGSEVGQPCDGAFCGCDTMTDDWAALEVE